MSLLRWKVFSVAVFLAISTMTLSVVKAQDAQPMSEIALGSGTATGGGALDGMVGDGVVADPDGGTGTIHQSARLVLKQLRLTARMFGLRCNSTTR